MAESLSAKILTYTAIGLLAILGCKKQPPRPLTADEIKKVNSVEERKEELFRKYLDGKYSDTRDKMNELMETYENADKRVQRAMKESVEEALYWTLDSYEEEGMKRGSEAYRKWGKRNRIKPKLHD